MDSNKTAFLFPGQGAQKVGMGKELVDLIPECKQILDYSEDVLDMPIKKLIFEGSDDVLMQTEIAQPTIVVTSLIALKALEVNGIQAQYTTGLSLGEYTSLIYAGVLSIEDGLLLSKERGRIMGNALPKDLGKMAAILKLDNDKLEQLLAEAGKFGIIEGANYNCPGQVVVSGENKAIESCEEIAAALGGKAKILNVSGPFHSSLLKDASEEFYKTLKDVNMKNPQKIVYSNLKGLPYEADDDMKDILKRHMRSSVLFDKTIDHMIGQGVEAFIEVGPGRALSGFVKKINRKLKVLNVQDKQSLDKTMEALKE